MIFVISRIKKYTLYSEYVSPTTNIIRINGDSTHPQQELDAYSQY